ncbi:MAG: glycosyltransferase family 2 protein [Peptococcales bacterium]|jgi:GT2 family glycosyltransferase
MIDVDIVILSWNRAKMTLEAIASVLLQKDVNVFVWIVDQGSEQQELRKIKKFTSGYSNIKIIELDKNVGVAAGRNIGMRLGKGKYIFNLDNDAVFASPYALKKAVDRFIKDEGIGIIGFRIKNFYSGQDDELSWVYPKLQRKIRDQEFVTTRFIGGGHGILREVFEKCEGYDDNLFFYWEEVDLSYQAINLGYKIIYFPDVVILHKVSPEVRLEWKNGRYYYLVRNRIYLQFKFERKIFATVILAIGYLVKGIYNFLPLQALKGIGAAFVMCVRLWPTFRNKQRLTNGAYAYINKYELHFRGSLLERLRQEVFVKLP